MGCWCRGTKFLWREGSVGGAKEIERNCIDKVRVLNAVALHCIVIIIIIRRSEKCIGDDWLS